MNAPAVAAETRHSFHRACRRHARRRAAGDSRRRVRHAPRPMSRERFPKQLIGLLGEHSLLQSTALCLDGLAADHPLNDDVLIVCGEDHRFTTAEQLRLTGKSASIMLEPIGRDTAPALTLAAFRLVANGNDAVMTVMPADHAVADLPRFHAAVAAGVHCAMQGKIATMGIVPKHAETGYGYIRVGALLGDAATPTRRAPPRPFRRETASRTRPAVRRIGRILVEQRHLHRSRVGLAEGDPPARTGHLRGLRTGRRPARPTAISSVSIAKRSRGVAVELDRLRGDGAAREPAAPARASSCRSTRAGRTSARGTRSGRSRRRTRPRTSAAATCCSEGAESTFAHSESRLVACVGTQNLVVVETPDAVLVADKSRVQDVKKIVGRIKAQRGAEATDHRRCIARGATTTRSTWASASR